MKERVVYINSDLYPGGKFVLDSEARLSIWDVGYTYGYNVYDSARTIKGKPWQLKEHIARFYRCCKACRLEPGITPEELERISTEVCSRNEHLLNKSRGEDYAIMFEATPGEYGFFHGRPLPAPEGKGRPTLIVKNQPIWSQAIYSIKGVHLVTPSSRQIPPHVRDPKIKTYSRMSQVFAIHEAQLVDPESWPLMLNIHGNLTETHWTNIFLVYDGVMMTPTTCEVLEGISRSNVIYLAKQLGIPVVERDLQPFHLYNAEEAFVSTTPYCILPISRYNCVSVGKEVPGPITKRLTEAWSKWVDHDITCLSYLSEEEKTKIGNKI